MKPFLDPFPFRNPENRSDLAAVIAEITTEKTPAPIPPSKAGTRYDKYGDKLGKKPVPTKANIPPSKAGTRYDKVGKVTESTEGDLHGGGATSPPPRKSKTIRTPRVMPVAEARKGIRKTRYGQALQRLGDAANRIKANPPKPPVNPFKKPVQEASECEQAAMARQGKPPTSGSTRPSARC